MISHLPILIVGAGPTGLMMACELARFGIPFRIIDKNPELDLEGDALLHKQTLEIFDHIGIVERFLKPGYSFKNEILKIPQMAIAKILTARLEEFKKRVERSVELIDVKTKGKSIELLLRDGKHRLEKVTCSWLIACDGCNSTIRKNWIAPVWYKSKMVNVLREGQILLLGDAIHANKKPQTQGINTGIADAYNLGWKLALIVKNTAKATIIESYDKERRPVSVPVTEIVNVYYPRSPLIDYSVKLSAKMPRQGGRMPNVKADKWQLYDYLRNVQHNIIVFLNNTKPLNVSKIQELLNWAAKEFPHVVKTHIISKEKINCGSENVIIDDKNILLDQLHVQGTAIYIVRPDTYIAYASHNLALNPIKKFFNKFVYAKN